jgi:hypothetical protein
MEEASQRKVLPRGKGQSLVGAVTAAEVARTLDAAAVSAS